MATELLRVRSAPEVFPASEPLLRLGDYELIEEIARGVMGVVFRARQVSLDREVAVKLMREAWLARGEDVRRFRAEAAAAAKLRHPNIVAIHEIGEESGQHYFAMDLIEGTNLAERTREGPLPAREAAELVVMIAAAWRYLWRRTRSDERSSLGRHSDIVTVVSYTRNGAFVASGSHDGTVKLWDTDTRKEICRLTLPARVRSLAFSPDGKTLAVSTLDWKVTVWDWNQRHQRAVFSDPVVGEGEGALAFTPDGKALLTGGGNQLEVWSVVDYHRIQRFAADEKCINTLAFSPDGKTLASGGEDNTVRFWDTATWELKRTIPAVQKSKIASIQYSPDGQYILTSGFDPNVKLWSIDSLEQIGPFAGNPNKAVHTAKFSRDGRYIATASADQSIGIWDATTFRELARLQGHQDKVSALTFSPDGQTLVSGGEDGWVKLWDGTPPQATNSFLPLAQGATRLGISKDGRISLVKYAQGVQVWDTSTRQNRGLIPTGGIASLSSAGGFLALGMTDGKVQIFSLNPLCATAALTGMHVKDVDGLALSPDGSLVASVDFAGQVQVRDWRTQRRLAHWNVISGFCSVAFAPDGHMIAIGSGDGAVELRRIADGRFLGRLTRYKEVVAGVTFSRSVRSMDFSPDGHILAVGSGDSTTTLWDVRSGHMLATLRGNRSGVNCVAFSRDGSRLATCGGEGAIKLWDLVTQQEVFTFTGRSKAALVAFEPDGKTLVSLGWDGISYWAAPSFEEIHLAEPNLAASE